MILNLLLMLAQVSSPAPVPAHETGVSLAILIPVGLAGIAAFAALIGIIWTSNNKRMETIEARAEANHTEQMKNTERLFDKIDNILAMLRAVDAAISGANASMAHDYVTKADCDRRRAECLNSIVFRQKGA